MFQYTTFNGGFIPRGLALRARASALAQTPFASPSSPTHPARCAQLAPLATVEEDVAPSEQPEDVALFVDLGALHAPLDSPADSAVEEDAATSVATALACAVCMSRERSVACVPCGHRCLCEDCGRKEVVGLKCPMCRQDVREFMRVYG
jgi:hypothetical protein